ncbi:DMT family transporter [Streptomyces sp. NPDC127098]|uniref:DMT family transporter n=1 Tax=Streptomyces sp. NPDC127098 TaxID=3347137 RepID=UPI003654DEF9
MSNEPAPGPSRSGDLRSATAALGVALCAALSGTVSVLVAGLTLSPTVIAFWRVVTAAAALAILLAPSRHRRLLRFPGPVVLVPGVLMGVQWVMHFAALQQTSIISAVLMTSTAPVLVALLAPLLLRERPTPLSLTALPLAVAATAVVVTGGEGGAELCPVGVAFGAGSALSYALWIICLKRYADDIDPTTLVFYQTLVAALVLSPTYLLARPALTRDELGRLVLLGVLLTACLGIAYQSLMRRVTALELGVLSYVEPGTAALLAVALEGEPLSLEIVAGGTAIFLAGGLVTLGNLRSPRDRAPALTPAGRTP